MSSPVIADNSWAFTGSATTGMPDPTCVGRVGQFIVIGLAGTATGDPFSIQWSAIGDPADWPTPDTADARTKQSGLETLSAEYGKVTGIAGNDFFGYVFQESAITKMVYVGGDIVFTFDTFEVSRGAFEYNRLAQSSEGRVFFQSEWGYHELLNDQVNDIGAGAVDRTYTPLPASSGGRTSAYAVAINNDLNTVFFNDRNLAYNYKTRQWTLLGDHSGDDYFKLHDPDFNTIGTVEWTGNTFDIKDNEPAGIATVTAQTAFGELNTGGRFIVDAVRPRSGLHTVSACTVTVKDIPTEGATTSVCTGTALNSRTGKSNFRTSSQYPEGRFASITLTYTTATDITGADIEFFAAGRD